MIYRAINLWKKKYELRSKAEQFVDLTLLFNGTDYGWGKENMSQCDCSGLISSVLALMGYPIRTTAESFRKNFFTIETNYKFDPMKVKAVFFVAKESYSTQSGNRLEGQAKHVGILVGDNIVFSATHPKAQFETIEAITQRYDTSDRIIRELDWLAVEKDEGRYAFDPELQ